MLNIIQNVMQFENLDEYIKDQNEIYLDSYNLEDFQHDIDLGYITDITCGTYNGQSNKFNAWELTESNLYNTILQAIKDFNFYEMFDDSDFNRENYNNDDWVQEYVEFYDIIIIEDTKNVYAISR